MQDQDLLGAEDKAKEIAERIKGLFTKQEYKKLSIYAKIRKWVSTNLAKVKQWIDSKIGKNKSQLNEEKYKYSKKPSNMYAIYGGWGTGKTRLLEELKVLIENDYKVVWFRPWEYFEESQNIDKKLLSILLDKNKVGKWVCLSLILFVILTIFTIGNMQWFQANIWQNFIALNIYDYSVVIGGITIAFVILLSKFNLIQYISNLAMGAVGFDITEIFSKLRDYTKYSEDIQKEVSSKIEKQTIVFVDDLDRCRKETVVEVLEHTKHFYASDKLFFVFAIDRKSLATYIAEHYNYQTEKGEIDFDRGYQYLDKLFPDSYNLRYLDGRKLFAQYLEYNEIYYELTDTDRENYYLLVEYYATFNWRKVEALIDKFAEIYKKIGYSKVIEVDDNKFIYLDQIFRWCLVHEFYPEVFEERNWRKEVIEKFYNNSEDKQDNLFRSNPFSDNNRNIYFQAIEDKEINKTFYLEKLYNYSNTFTSRDQDITYSWSLPNLRNTVEESLLSKLKVYYLNAENSQKEVEVFIKNVHFKYGGNFSDNETDIYNGADDIIKLLKVCIGMEVKKISDPEIQSIKLGSSKVKIAKM